MSVGALRGDEGDLFRRHYEPLLRSVRRAVNAPAELIEDACATAWTQLLRSQPERGPALFGWLRTVAIHEAYRLSRSQRRDAALEQRGCFDGEGGSSGDGWEAVIESRTDLDTELEARRALDILASLPERQRRYLALLVAGYRYHEIVQLAGVTYTNVNKHLTRARASVRRAQQAA